MSVGQMVGLGDRITTRSGDSSPAALMSLNMLIETVGGRNYTPAEYRAWLEDVGFREVRVVWFEVPGANGVVDRI
jgi:hypothetical protein